MGLDKGPAVVDWGRVETVFLDMDGTLLDLAFDNDFWLHRVPAAFAARNGIAFDAACERLYPRMRALRGTMDWYCIEFWSRELDLDIVALKTAAAGGIRLRDGAGVFLGRIKAGPRRVVLLTNAHEKTIAIKFATTGIEKYFDSVISSHRFGVPKEDARFWLRLSEHLAFDAARSLFIDDSLPVLQAARRAGVAQLLSVARPDSTRAPDPPPGFAALENFADIMPPAGETT